MKLYIQFFLAIFTIAIFGLSKNGLAQPFSVNISVSNQPNNYILFGSVSGDNFTVIDSSYLYPSTGNVIFKFPENTSPGTYRILFGQTPYAKVMDESPQILDFIFNNENLVFETDFKTPLESLEVIQSAENKAWFNFQKQNQIITKELQDVQKVLDMYWLAVDSVKAINMANEYNTLQMERDMFVKEWIEKTKGLIVSSYIKNQREPLLDGYLLTKERNDLFKKEFFKVLDFSDERLIHSSVYSDNVFKYLVSYNHPDYTKEQRIKEYKNAVDIVLSNVDKNERVYSFILDYLVDGFKMLQLDEVISYINKNYKS